MGDIEIPHYSLVYTGFGLAVIPSICHSISHNFVPLNVLRTSGQNFTKILYACILAKSGLGLLPVIFHKFVTQLWP